MVDLSSVSLMPVAAATIAAMAVGFIWYHPKVFGTKWMKLVNFTPQPQEPGMCKSMLSGLALTFVSAFVIALILGMVNPSTMKDGLTVGFLLWLGLAAPCYFNETIWEKRPFELAVLNSGHSLANIVVVVAVLSKMA